VREDCLDTAGQIWWKTVSIPSRLWMISGPSLVLWLYIALIYLFQILALFCTYFFNKLVLLFVPIFNTYVSPEERAVLLLLLLECCGSGCVPFGSTAWHWHLLGRGPGQGPALSLGHPTPQLSGAVLWFSKYLPETSPNPNSLNVALVSARCVRARNTMQCVSGASGGNCEKKHEM